MASLQHRLRVASLCLLLGPCAANLPSLRAQQPAPDALALARKVDDHYNHLSSLQAHYTEHYVGMGRDHTESGTLLLKKPGRMRWSYEAPAAPGEKAQPTGKLFLLDGKSVWSYTPGDAQAQRAPAKQLDDLRSPLRFLLGHTQLAKELDNLTLTPAGASFILSGTPKGMADRIQSLALTVTPAGIIQAMRIQEVDGSVTDFTFSALKENVPVRDADFVFTPPPGVTVVNGLPPI